MDKGRFGMVVQEHIQRLSQRPTERDDAYADDDIERPESEEGVD